MHPLKRWLKKSGITQRDFAKELGVSPGTVSFWIGGRNGPRGPLGAEIARRTDGEVPIDCWNNSVWAAQKAKAALRSIPDDAPDSTLVTIEAGTLRYLMGL